MGHQRCSEPAGIADSGKQDLRVCNPRRPCACPSEVSSPLGPPKPCSAPLPDPPPPAHFYHRCFPNSLHVSPRLLLRAAATTCPQEASPQGTGHSAPWPGYLSGSAEAWWHRGLSLWPWVLGSGVCQLPGLDSTRAREGCPLPKTFPAGPGASQEGPPPYLFLTSGQTLSNHRLEAML